MSPIDPASSLSSGSAIQNLILQIAANMGAVAEAGDAAGQTDDSQAAAPFLLADSSSSNLAPNTLALSLAGLRPPQSALSDLAPATGQTSLTPTALSQALADSAAGGAGLGGNGLAAQAGMTQSVFARGAESTYAGFGGGLGASAPAAGQPSIAVSHLPAEALQSTLAALQHLAVNPALVADGGVIASLIANAGMMSGLLQPPLNIPLALPGALVGAAATDDEQALTYLANLGANEALLEKLRKLLKKKIPGKQLLVGLAALMTAIEVVRQALTGELKAAAEDRKFNEEARATAESRGYQGQRRRLYLE